jgi:hypothetical protein
MANLRNELKSRQASLRRLHDDLRESSFARRAWNSEVRPRRTLGSDATIEHWFLAEHFLVTWSNWTGLLDRFCRYFGQEFDTFPKTWAQLVANCDLLVFMLARDRVLDEAVAKSWIEPEPAIKHPAKRNADDIASIYTSIARNHERAAVMSRARHVQPAPAVKEKVLKQMSLGDGEFGMSQNAVLEENERLLERWQKLPRRVQDQVLVHLRHYTHSTLGVSWLTDSKAGISALTSISWRRQPVSLSLQKPAGLPALDAPIPDSAGRLLDRLKVAIAELGYDAVSEDLASTELVGGEDSLLASRDVMVVPGHLDDAARPILLAVTKGWSGKEPQSFTKIMRQVKTRLIESPGAIRFVIVVCDCWDSASFQEEHHEELRAHAQKGVRFLFIMVGVPDRVLVPVPVEFDMAKG